MNVHIVQLLQSCEMNVHIVQSLERLFFARIIQKKINNKK